MIITASARFSSINGTHCAIQSSNNDGASFTTVGRFAISASGTEFAGSGNAAVPVFNPGAVMRFQLTCQSDGGPATLTEARMGVTAGPQYG